MNKDLYIIKTINDRERKTIIEVFKGLGFSFVGKSETEEKRFIKENEEHYPYIGVDFLDKSIDMYRPSTMEDKVNFNQLHEVLLNLANCPKQIQLNDQYAAIVREDYVEVGCQKFSHDKILELAEFIKNSKGN